MKTTHTLRRLLLSLLSLALVAPATLHAQTPDAAKPPTITNRERSAITTKLREIRFDSISYRDIPLSEVVRMLKAETIKRDPEKKGINFMANPNPGPVDLDSISIKIDPPLADLRLVDVLDVIVKVADRPIKYTVEDYGVVFSPNEPEPTQRAEVVFSFPGGTPQDFIKAVQAQFQVDWENVTDLPREMHDVRIPRLRLNLAAGLDARPAVEGGPLGALVTLYNQVGEQKPELGHLVIRGDLAKPSVVLFVPSKNASDLQPKFKVKAFSLYGLNDEARAKLIDGINHAQMEAIEYTMRQRGSSGTAELSGMVGMHKDTNLLVATGQEAFVEMVESMVAASMANERAKNPGAPIAQPSASAK
jgi:hypothetical protein